MTTHDGPQWNELARRENDGLRIALFWDKTSGRAQVEVLDDHFDQAFAFGVEPRDALAAFYHPFAYAPPSLRLGGAACDPLDLQAQN
jgi:hypothetical protein